MKGYFITIEGGEGAGKSTVITELKKHFEKKGYRVVTTREPGGIPVAEQIRSIILDVNNTEIDERTEALLYAAARRQHLVEKVIPLIEKGYFVLCDRFIDSSLAYQGYARGIDMDELLNINRFAIESMMPQVTLYFDIEPEVGLARVKKDETREVNRLDLENITFHQKVRDGYLKLLEQFPGRMVRIDAQQALPKVIEDSVFAIKSKLYL